MSWKKITIKPLIYSAIYFVFVVLLNLYINNRSFVFSVFTKDIVKSIGIGLGAAGIIEIMRDTDRKLYRIMANILFAGFAVYFVLPGLFTLLNITSFDWVVDFLSDILWLPFVVTYPLISYLNYRSNQPALSKAATHESE